jgi:hypothetical protein
MRTHTWIILVVSAGIALALAAAPNDVQENPGAEAQLQAAINKETVEGDLKGAIELYRKLADSDDHAVAAKALVRMGQCHEKLGNAEARRAYERVVRDFSDQKEMVATAQARLAALAAAGGTAGSPTLTVRRVLEGPFLGKVSADGRFLSFTDDNGNVAVRDLATGRRRVLTDNAGYAEPSILSPDGRSVAYTSGGLWVVGTDGSKPKVLRARGNGVHHAWPVSWSPDSRHLLAEFVKTDGTFDMMLVSVEDGSAKLLKAMGRDQSPGGEFSPDGRYIAWATGTSRREPNRLLSRTARIPASWAGLRTAGTSCSPARVWDRPTRGLSRWPTERPGANRCSSGRIGATCPWESRAQGLSTTGSSITFGKSRSPISIRPAETRYLPLSRRSSAGTRGPGHGLPMAACSPLSTPASRVGP